MSKFYTSRPDRDGNYSEYWLEDAVTTSVIRKDYRLTIHAGGRKPVLERTEIIEGFLIKKVDSKAKEALTKLLGKPPEKK